LPDTSAPGVWSLASRYTLTTVTTRVPSLSSPQTKFRSCGVDGRLLLSLDAALLTESIGVPDAELPAVLRAIDVLRGGDNDNGACRAACLRADDEVWTSAQRGDTVPCRADSSFDSSMPSLP
jgi:hypothetical protein